GFDGTPDQQADRVNVIATSSDDAIKLTTSGTQTIVDGLAAETRVDHADALDTLSVLGGAGNDTFDLSALGQTAGVVALDVGEGNGTGLIKGTSGGDSLFLIADGPGQIFLAHADGTGAAVSLTNVENLLLQGQGGDDTLSAGNGFPAGVALTID